MKTVKINELKGGEYLASPVIDQNQQILFYEGSRLMYAQIDKLIENGIEEVDIIEEITSSKKTKEIIKEEVYTDCKEKVKSLLNNHVCKDDDTLVKITETAEEIMDDILNKEEIVEKVYDIKERSADLYDHSISVSALSIITAVKLNMDKKAIYSIGIGSLLHDMGLKFLTIDYRNIDTYRLSPENLFEYRKHTLYGFSSVEKENWMSSMAKKVILFHHERINGTGYPLKQKNIPLEVRIVSVCDAFDDLICGIGAEQVRVDEAIEYIQKYKNVYFDGAVADIFLQFVAKYPVGTRVKLNTGEIGVVVEQNDHYTDRPVLKLETNREGKSLSSTVIINLVEERDFFIESVLS